MSITFIAKFDEREGNSCHIHFSLADAYGPLFAREQELFESFLAGQLACLREMTLLLAPNVNSYKRYAAGSFAPTAVAWGHDNRTCSLRVVGHGAGLRFENRAGGADLNPYLALSAIIASGLYGIQEGLTLEEAYTGNAYLATDKPRLPTTLREARELFAASRRGARRAGRSRRRSLRQRGGRRTRRVRGGRHRLGAAAGVRAILSGTRRGSTDDDHGDTRLRRIARHRLCPCSLPNRIRGDGRATRDGDPARTAAARDAPACRARAVRAARDRPFDAAPGTDRARPERAPHAMRGRGGGTFVADVLPPSSAADRGALRPGATPATRGWRSRSGWRCSPPSAATARRSTRSTELVLALDGMLEDFAAYRHADVRFHVGLAEATRSPRLVAAMTETQGAMTGLIALIAHPPGVLAVLQRPAQSSRSALRRRDGVAAAREMAEHLRGTEHVLAGLLPRERTPGDSARDAPLSACAIGRLTSADDPVSFAHP